MRRVRVVVAPDSFGGTLTAVEAAAALASAWPAPHEVVQVPLSDGGPGFLDALPGVRVTALVEDPLARPQLASFLLDGGTAYVESAQAAGLQLLDPADRDPTRTTSYGVGQLVAAAAEAGATRVVIGLGGTATNDGGAGLLAALGLRREDAQGNGLAPGGLALASAARLVGSPPELELVAATDVDNPLLGPYGATHVFGPQKGASAAQVQALEAALARWADVVEERLGVAVRDLPGAGAAGGLGFALLALGAQRVPGFDVVAAATGLDGLVAHADLVITGEGRLDASSTRGKVVSGVARVAGEHGVPCVAVAGEVLLGQREAGAAGLSETWSLVDHDEQHARSDAARVLSEVAVRVARAWGVAQ
jgi:glycerate kinase